MNGAGKNVFQPTAESEKKVLQRKVQKLEDELAMSEGDRQRIKSEHEVLQEEHQEAISIITELKQNQNETLAAENFSLKTKLAEYENKISELLKKYEEEKLEKKTDEQVKDNERAYYINEKLEIKKQLEHVVRVVDLVDGSNTEYEELQFLQAIESKLMIAHARVRQFMDFIGDKLEREKEKRKKEVEKENGRKEG